MAYLCNQKDVHRVCLRLEHGVHTPTFVAQPDAGHCIVCIANPYASHSRLGSSVAACQDSAGHSGLVDNQSRHLAESLVRYSSGPEHRVHPT